MIEHVIARPRILILGVLCLVHLSVVGLVLEWTADVSHTGPTFDLFLAAASFGLLLSFCLFVMECRTPDRFARASMPSDPWTGLMLQPAFQAIVETAIRSDDGGVVVLLSIDGLPQAGGDEALRATLQKEMALRLSEGVPPDAVLAVLSPHEFSLLLPGVEVEGARPIVDVLVNSCCNQVSVGVRTFQLACHAGLASIASKSYERSDQALRAAGIALATAKSNGGSGIVNFDPKISSAVMDREKLIKRLPRAIYDKQLEVYLQPRVALADQRILGFESLARWSVEDRVIEAHEIVSLASDAGLLVELDTLMLHEAVRVVADWNRRRKTVFSLSANLTSFHFLSPAGTKFIAEALEAYDFAANLLTFEFSETRAFGAEGAPLETLAALRAIGCRLSVDDFGAGSASLSDLRALSADEIKIDGRLLADLEASEESQAILAAVMNMATLLNIETVAEGVERPEQAKVLIKLGCKHAQGFLFGHPRPAQEWLEDATFGKRKEMLIAAD